MILDELSVSSIAERSVCGLFAVTELIVAAFVDIERDGSVTSNSKVAAAITAGVS